MGFKRQYDENKAVAEYMPYRTNRISFQNVYIERVIEFTDSTKSKKNAGM